MGLEGVEWGWADMEVSWVFHPTVGRAHLLAYGHTCNHMGRGKGGTGRGVKIGGYPPWQVKYPKWEKWGY